MRVYRLFGFSVLVAGVTAVALGPVVAQPPAKAAQQAKRLQKQAELQKKAEDDRKAAETKKADDAKKADDLAKMEKGLKQPAKMATGQITKDPAELARKIDEALDTKLTAAKVNPSPLCTDSEFLRRAYLDITGVIPSTDKA